MLFAAAVLQTYTYVASMPRVQLTQDVRLRQPEAQFQAVCNAHQPWAVSRIRPCSRDSASSRAPSIMSSRI